MTADHTFASQPAVTGSAWESPRLPGRLRDQRSKGDHHTSALPHGPHHRSRPSNGTSGEASAPSRQRGASGQIETRPGGTARRITTQRPAMLNGVDPVKTGDFNDSGSIATVDPAGSSTNQPRWHICGAINAFPTQDGAWTLWGPSIVAGTHLAPPPSSRRGCKRFSSVWEPIHRIEVGATECCPVLLLHWCSKCDTRMQKPIPRSRQPMT
jgi:hypothetical protein